MTDNNSTFRKNFKRTSLKVLTPKVLTPNSDRTKELKSISEFIREQLVLRNARELSRRTKKAKRLDIPPDQMPLNDSVWKKYQYSSINLEEFDIFGCEKDEYLFDFGREFVEQVNAAEIGPDDGIPINGQVTLPRSFLLDSIHLAASQHCMYMQKKLGKPVERSECPSPAERAQPFNDIDAQYRKSIKIMVTKMKVNWNKFGINKATNDASNDNDNESGNEEETNEVTDADESTTAVLSPSDPDFDLIQTRLLDVPFSIGPDPPSYEYSDTNDYGADMLWSFDTSSLLAFGMLAEEFIEKMIDIHLAKNADDNNSTEHTNNILNQEAGSLLE